MYFKMVLVYFTLCVIFLLNAIVFGSNIFPNIMAFPRSFRPTIGAGGNQSVEIIPTSKFDGEWEKLKPSIANIFDFLEQSCLKSRNIYDKKKAEDEFVDCLKPTFYRVLEEISSAPPMELMKVTLIKNKIVLGETLLSEDELSLLHNHVTQHGCDYVIKLLDCLNPSLNEVIGKCVSEQREVATGYLNKIFRVLCRNNGTKLMDFLRVGGLGCKRNLNQTDYACLETNMQAFRDDQNRTSGELCSHFNKTHHCVYDILDKCPTSQQRQSILPILNDISNWLSDDCLEKNDSSTIQGVPPLKFVSICLGFVVFLLLIFFLIHFWKTFNTMW